MEIQKKSVLLSVSAALTALVLLAIVGLILYAVSMVYNPDRTPVGLMLYSGFKPYSPDIDPTVVNFQAKVDVFGIGPAKQVPAKQVDVEIVTQELGKQTFTNQTLPFTKSFSGQSKNQIAITVKNTSETGDVHVTLTVKERGPVFNSDSTRSSFCSGGGCSVTVSGKRPGKLH